MSESSQSQELGERLAGLEASHNALVESFRSFAAEQAGLRRDIQAQFGALTDGIASARKTDWRAIIAATGLVLTLVSLVGGAAVTELKEQLALVRTQVQQAASRTDVARIEGSLERMTAEALHRAQAAGALQSDLRRLSDTLERHEDQIDSLEARLEKAPPKEE